MESLQDFIEEGSAIFLFCLALALLFMSDGSMLRLLSEAKEQINQNPVLYMKQVEEKNQALVSYEEVIALLMNDLTTDLQINSIELNADQYNYQTFDFTKIKKTRYRESFLYNTDGNLKKIILQSEGG